MNIQENISLKPYNTMGIDARAQYFASFTSAEELAGLLESTEKKKAKRLILGGGSNLLLTGNFNGWVLKNDIRGIDQIKEDTNHIYLKAGAGENWHALVQYTIERNWAGLENLSLIPGCVGASPMQNIGAYGVEMKDAFDELEAFDTKDRKMRIFSTNDCEFGYRESIFKRKHRDRFVILNVTYRLNKTPRFHTSYGAIGQELERMGIKELSIRAISQAVINIRQSKLPDPAVIGNAGSFFKNPSVPQKQFAALQTKFPGIVGYNNPDGTVKLAAGWLIEHAAPKDAPSWKGYRRGDAGCHERQALVLVNYGAASGQDIYQLSEDILQSVKGKFGVTLEREVNII